MIKSLIFLLLLQSLFAKTIEAKSDVYFANGIVASKEDADDTIDEIEDAFETYNPTLYKSVGEWKVAYNTTHGIAIDLYETMIQKIYEDKPGKSLIPFIWNAGSLPTGLNYAFKGLISKIAKKLPKAQLKAFASKQAKFLAKQSVSFYNKNYAKKFTEEEIELMFNEVFDYLIEQAIGSYVDQKEEDILKQELADINTQLISYLQSMNSGREVLVVAHSQGNLFVNRAYELFAEKGNPYLDASMQQCFKAIGVATPANNVIGKNFPYYTFDNDMIRLVPDSLPATIENPTRYQLTDEKGKVLVENLFSPEAHSFLNSYMSTPLTSSLILNAMDLYIEDASKSKQYDGDIVVTASSSSNVHFNVNVALPGTSVNDASPCQTGSVSAFYGNSADVTPGTYAVSVVAKSVDDDITYPSLLNISVQAPGSGVQISLPIKNSGGFSPGHVADIIVCDGGCKKGEGVRSIINRDVYPGAGSMNIGDTREHNRSDRSDRSGSKSSLVFEVESVLPKAYAGPLSGAGVSLYALRDSNSSNPLFSGYTSFALDASLAGIIAIPSSTLSALDDLEYYTLEIVGGMDTDANDDGVTDKVATKNYGTLHAIVRGDALKAWEFRATVLTEIAYHDVMNRLSKGMAYSDVAIALDEIARRLLVKDLTDDGFIDYADLQRWIPAFNKSALRKPYAPLFSEMIRRLKQRKTIDSLITKALYEPLLRPIRQTVDENSSATVALLDLELYDGAVTFALDGNESAPFGITDDGTLIVQHPEALDYEKKRHYQFQVLAKTSDANYSSTVDVTIADIRDNPFVADLQAHITENAQPGELVGVMPIEEGFGALTGITLDGAAKDWFSVELNGSIRVAEGAKLDYETAQSHSLVVQASNAFGKSNSAQLQIIVDDVLDAPYVHNATFAVNEHNASGSYVGTVLIDEGVSLVEQVELSGSGSELFTIERNGTLFLNEDSTLDYERNSSYTLYATASNSNGTSLPATVRINVRDFRPIVLENVSLVAKATSALSESLGNITIHGLEFATIDAFILQGEDASYFNIENNGSIYATTFLDALEKQSFSFSAYAQSSEGDSNEVNVTVSIGESKQKLSDFGANIVIEGQNILKFVEIIPNKVIAAADEMAGDIKLLSIVDFNQTERIAQIDFGGLVKDAYYDKSSQRLLGVDYYTGLQLIDVSSPSSASTLAYASGSYRFEQGALLGGGQYAVASSGKSLYFIDFRLFEDVKVIKMQDYAYNIVNLDVTSDGELLIASTYGVERASLSLSGSYTVTASLEATHSLQGFTLDKSEQYGYCAQGVYGVEKIALDTNGSMHSVDVVLSYNAQDVIQHEDYLFIVDSNGVVMLDNSSEKMKFISSDSLIVNDIYFDTTHQQLLIAEPESF